MTVQRVLKTLSIVAAAVIVVACSNPETKKAQHLQAGDVLVDQKKYAEATIEYRNALKVDEHFAEARLKLAKAYEEMNDLGRALREYVRAADLMPDNAEVQLAAARLLVARASCRLATFAVAVASSNPTAANSTISGNRTSAVRAAVTGSAAISIGPVLPNTAWVVMPVSAASRPRAVPSAAACAALVPGRSVAIALNTDS